MYIEEASITENEKDLIPPIPGGNGKIKILGSPNTNLRLTWEKAEDNVSDTQDLQYRVYVSEYEEYLYSYSNSSINAKEVTLNWTLNINSIAVPISLLGNRSTYYFVVFVRDTSKNTNSYVIEKK